MAAVTTYFRTDVPLLGVLEHMAKKYLSLEEAAGLLDMTTEQLMKIREQGEIRGFADRGSWKFREQDIDEFQRSRQVDSSPDFPIITGDSSSSVLEGPDAADVSSSDSDVRLFFDQSLFDDTDSEVSLSADSGFKISDSDSDVRLSGEDDDSDVQLADDDVNVAEDDLAATGLFDGSDSDSDVKLMGSDDLLLPDEDSDSDVKLSADLDRTDSDIRLAEPSPPPTARLSSAPSAKPSPAPTAKPNRLQFPPDDSDLKLINKGSGVRKDKPDSGISLEVRGSGLGLEADESGISLEMDSGISLDADDSGISLESYDSGISLEGFESGTSLRDDSGLTLEAGDSGISLDQDDDSGISMQPDDMGRTMPMQAIPGAKAALSDSTTMTTQFEIPKSASGHDSEFELAGLDDEDDEVGSNTGVLTFDDDGDLDSSRTVAVPALSGAAVKGKVAKKVIEDEESSYDDDGEEEFGDDGDLDVHDSEEFDDDNFESGQSQVAGFPVPLRAGRADVDWSIGTKIMIGISTLVSVMCAVVGIELVRTMWLWTQPSSDAPVSSILQMIGGAF